MSEDIKDASARLAATAALATGVGIAAYKSIQDMPGPGQRLLEAVQSTPIGAPRMMVNTPIDESARLLSQAFSAVGDVMGGPLGAGAQDEFFRRVYERSLYRAGVLTPIQREGALSELLQARKRGWESTKAAINKLANQVGGTQGVYQSMREVLGGTVKGNRMKEVDELVRELPSLYNLKTSDFAPNGRAWKELFRLDPFVLQKQARLQAAERGYVEHASRLGREARHLNFAAGIRESNRPRLFQADQSAVFSFDLPGSRVPNPLELTFSEIAVSRKSSATSASEMFLQVPQAAKRGNTFFVATDHRGMGFASVPKFAIPVKNGKGVKIVSWNAAMEMAISGSEELESVGVKGLAKLLHDTHGDAKAMRDISNTWNQQIRSLFHRVTGAQGNMTQAFMHSQSVIPLDRLMRIVAGEKVDTSVEGLSKFYEQLMNSGVDVGPLSASSMSNYRVSLLDWSKRWDVFGEGYAMEKKYTSRVRNFGMSDEALEAMRASPIGGILQRGHGITASAMARREMNEMPQAVAYLSLDRAKHFSEEEAVISRRLSPMMKMRDVQKYEVLAGTTMAGQGELMKHGAIIGVDYRNGKPIYARGIDGMVEQRIIGAHRAGDIVSVEVETLLPMQDQTKIFGYKAQIHQARVSMEKELRHEWGAGKAAMRFGDEIEFAGHAKLMKGIPQEINKQMAEASWLIMQKRLSEAGVIRSGGKSKVARQRIRKMRGQKTYTYKGGLPKDYVSMDMLMYVRDTQYRDKVLRNRQKRGLRLARRLGLKGDQESLGIGLEIMRHAKRNLRLAAPDSAKAELIAEELSLIGGAFYRELEGKVGKDNAEHYLRTASGLTRSEIDAISKAKGVLAMPTMHVGGYASFDNLWGRAGMDYRALMEISAQKWGPEGDMLVREIARRVAPAQDLMEMERAALSITGRIDELPEGLERITSIREARQAIGQREFLFEYGGKQIYVPSGAAKHMGKFVGEVGEPASEELRSAYERYFTAHERARDFPGEQSTARLDEAFDTLKTKVHKEWSSATSLRGKVSGTSGPVARVRVPHDPSQTLARMMSKEEYLKDASQVFRIGITKETGGKMFRDLIRKASGEEKTFLESEFKRFLAGEKVTGFVYRHPTHRPQSLQPTWFELVEGKGESAQFHRLEVNLGEGRVYDLSQAYGMKLDFDFDHVQTGIIADQKTKAAMDRLLHDRAYREQYLEGVVMQHDIMKRVKDAAAAGHVAADVPEYVKGLQRLVGVKLETGTISNLVGEMRAAAAFQASGQEFKIASYLLAELEEAPISSKHGLWTGEVRQHLSDFVKGKGEGVREGMMQAWDKLMKSEVFEAGKIKYSRDEFIDKMSGWLVASEESGQLGAWRNVTRHGAQAQKGKEMVSITLDQIYSAVKSFRGGLGDLNASLIREMRMGPGSAISRSRAVVRGLGEVASVLGRGMKKHWKYPAIGAAAAMGISAVLGGGNLSMRDHNASATELGQGPGVPRIAPPTMAPNRIVTAGGGAMPVGYEVSHRGDYNDSGLRVVGAMAQEINSSVRISDDRGAITPEYIEKARRERYY